MIEFMDDWRSLRSAPRDGTTLLVAVAPAYGKPGYVTLGRWCAPTSDDNLNKKKRELRYRYGGWWGRGLHSHPFGRPLLGWQPVPEFDFEAWAENEGGDHD